MSLSLKKAIQKELKSAGYLGRLDAQAFNEVVSFVVQQGENVGVVQDILKVFQRGELLPSPPS
jgi:hypothetical protein